MWSTVALCVTALLCGAYGQTPPVLISTTTISGSAGMNVTFSCDTQIAGQSNSIVLQVFVPESSSFLPFNQVEDGTRLQTSPGDSDITFTFGPLRQSDNGTVVRCTGRIEQDASESATIIVTFPPIITRNEPLGDTLTEREGQSFSVSFNVSANPQADFNWTRDGVLLTNDSVLTAALEYITFDPVAKEHDGLYTLNAFNSAGSGNHSFTLVVQYPPEFPAEMYTNANCTEQGTSFLCAAYRDTPTVTFNCAAIGNPPPMVQISHPGGDNTATTDNVITITSVRSENAGTYSCSATSTVFTQVNITRTFRFYVGGPPNPLSGTGVDIVNAGSVVTATWMYDNTVNAVPATYFVATVFQDGVQVGDPVTVPATSRNTTVPTMQLESGQMYTVSVVVRNPQGVSEAISESFTFNNAIGISLTYSLSLVLAVSVIFALF